jgi:Flp pilus assembly protein TadD
MISPRTVLWSLACVVCLVASVGALVLARREATLKIPGELRYDGRPAAFNQALDSARNRVHNGNYKTEDLRSIAHLFQANRLDTEALACYQIIAKRSGLNAHDHYYLAEIAQFQGDLLGAERELRATLETEPHYLPAQLALGAVLFKNGEIDKAKKEYSSILSIEANQPQAMFALARIDLMDGNDNAAVAQLEALMVSHPEMTSGASLLAQVFDRLGDAKRATVMTQWSRQKPEPEPEDPWKDALMASCYDIVLLGLKFEEYFATGQITLAVPFLSRIEELDPQSPVPQLLRGWEQSGNHHDQEAVDEYHLALEKGADAEKICPYMVKSLVALGKINDAARLLAEFYAKKPDSIPILEAYASVAVLQEDNRMARILLIKVLEKEPYLNSANLNLAKILWASGDRDDAAVCLQRLVEMNPSDVASRALLGQYYLDKSHPASAIGPLEQAVALENAQSAKYKALASMLYTAYVEAGNLLTEQGHCADAVSKYYEKAIKLAPDEQRAYASKAVACAQIKEYRSAAEALEKLASLQPRNPTVYLSLGDILYQEGDSKQARRDWQRAFDLTYSGDSELRNAINVRLSGNITVDTFR